MIKSMTAFAAVEENYDFGRLTWELRSVNHRFLDANIRMPEDFRVLEAEVRSRLSARLSRGKVDINLRFSPAPGLIGANLKLHDELADSLLRVYQELAAKASATSAPDLSQLLRWPGLIEQPPPDPQPMREAALALLDQAITQLVESREREGAAIHQALTERINSIQRWVGEIRQWMPEIRDGLRTKLIERCADLPTPLEPGRLEQEIALYAQKLDVDEELDRLAAHTEEGLRVLGLDEPVGRRFDFLLQEFHRESNTLSSKSVDLRTSQAAVELKVLIEQLREQVQNIE
ncbi:MAG: YicC family protein [Wenzhouxiangellaceae bacterium]